MEIKITKTQNPTQLPPEDTLGFGKVFTDHMFLMDYEEGKGWFNARIEPFGRISLHPASTVLHYGAEIFEGLKAYRRADGGVQLFRPMENIKRMNNSAERMSLPQIDEQDMLQILETKKVNDMDIATKVSVQLQLTDPAAKSRDRVVKKSEKAGLYTALDFGCVWLERALAGK